MFISKQIIFIRTMQKMLKLVLIINYVINYVDHCLEEKIKE